MVSNIVSDDSFVNLRGWMCNQGLSSCELIIFGLIVAFCEKTGVCHCSLRFFSSWTNTTERSCINAIHSLEKKALIRKKTVYEKGRKKNFYELGPLARKEKKNEAV